MKILVIPLAIIGLVLALILSPTIQERWEDSNQYRRQAEALDLERQQTALQDYQSQTAATAASRALASNAGYLGVVLIGLLSIAYAIDRAARRREPLVKFGGELVPRRLVESGRLIEILAHRLEMQDIALIEDKRRAIPPHVYSPHLTMRSTDLQLPEVAPASIAALDVPSFATLLDQGKIGPTADGRAQPLILGYSDAGAIEGSWRSLYSSSSGGLQGSGKTWGAAFLLAQSAAAGAKLICIDPQAGDSESLANRVAPLERAFLCPIADDDSAIDSALHLAYDILERRDKGDPDRSPVIVAIDEWLSLRRGRLADKLPQLVEAFSTRGRKMNVHALLLTQRADKDAFGDFRNTLASNYVYRMRPDEARMLTGLRASQLPDDVLSLPPGVAYLLDTRGSLTKVQIPRMAPADMDRVGAMLGEPSKEPYSQPSSGRPFGFAVRQMEGKRKASAEGSEGRPAAEKPTIEHARIVALFVAGKSIPEIVKQVFGLDSNSGRAYVEHRALVERVLRSALVERAA